MKDDSTRRAYRLYDFTKSRLITPGQYYCASGKVNSADKLYLVIESARPDNKPANASTAPVPADREDTSCANPPAGNKSRTGC
jgi:hypothetical protein